MLGIALQSKRMGYVLLANTDQILDFGVVDFTPTNSKKVIDRFRKVIERFDPDVACLQSLRERDCRLGNTSRQLIGRLGRECRIQGLSVRRVSKLQIWTALDLPTRTSKEKLARQMTEKYPALTHLLPVPRKLWDAEARNMCIFTALSLVHTHCHENFPD